MQENIFITEPQAQEAKLKIPLVFAKDDFFYDYSLESYSITNNKSTTNEFKKQENFNKNDIPNSSVVIIRNAKKPQASKQGLLTNLITSPTKK